MFLTAALRTTNSPGVNMAGTLSVSPTPGTIPPTAKLRTLGVAGDGDALSSLLFPPLVNPSPNPDANLVRALDP